MMTEISFFCELSLSILKSSWFKSLFYVYWIFSHFWNDDAFVWFIWRMRTKNTCHYYVRSPSPIRASRSDCTSSSHLCGQVEHLSRVQSLQCHAWHPPAWEQLLWAYSRREQLGLALWHRVLFANWLVSCRIPCFTNGWQSLEFRVHWLS